MICLHHDLTDEELTSLKVGDSIMVCVQEAGHPDDGHWMELLDVLEVIE